MNVNIVAIFLLALFSNNLLAQTGQLTTSTAQKTQAQTKIITTLQVPGIAEYCKLNPKGVSVLPNGRYVTPAGETVRITHDPFGLALTPDGKKAITLHDGVLTIINLQNPQQTTRIPSYDGKILSPLDKASFLGVAIAADSKTAYLSGGDKGNVIIFDIEKLTKTGEIKLDGVINGTTYEDSFTSDLIINPAKNKLLVLDKANFRMVRIDLATQKITASVKVGRLPFGIALSPDKNMAFVANFGLYEYPAVPGVTPQNGDTMMLAYPPYGVPSKEAENGTTFEGKKMPGLGSPLVPEAMSVWTIDLKSNTVIDKLKTGYQIGQMLEDAEVVGGASPNSIVVGKSFAYVSNATNDNISVIDYKSHKITGEIKIKVDKRMDQYRGLMPFGLALSKDEKTLYAALLAFNAIAVIDTKSGKTKGLIPTGWGPSKLALSADGKKLFAVTARGLGAGPNGGARFVKPVLGTYIGDIQLGTFQSIYIPDEKTLATYTKQVIDNTFREVAVSDDGKNPLPPMKGIRKSPIKHIVYITKENRTYDEVLGQLKTGAGDSTLARFGSNVTVLAKEGEKMTGVNVMPNHLNIASQFAYSDNFYCDSDASIYGHHWMVGTIPNEWIEANSSAAGTFKTFSKAPNRRFPKSTGSMDPEDYNEIGGLWEQLERNKISFYNFGEANEFAGVLEEWNHTNTGMRLPVIFPLPKALYDRTSWTYAGYNTNVPDQYRMDQFEKEFTDKWLSGKDTLPQLITLAIPNDHGAGSRADAGYPYQHSYMADNDLALGRTLHFLSKTPYWKNMLVIITEDDPQGGVDHIDGHRSILMTAGPYVKKGYTSRTHANFGSILKVIYNILDVGYVNQYDVTASLLGDFFADKPDFISYTVTLPDKWVFDPQKAMDVYKKTFDWSKIMQGPKMDHADEQRQEHYKQNK